MRQRQNLALAAKSVYTWANVMSAVPNFEAMNMNRVAWGEQLPEQAPESAEPPRLTPEQCRLAQENMDVVYGVVGKLQGTIPLERDDMLGDGFEILCGLTVSFDPALGVPFRAYAACMVRRRIIDRGRVAGMLWRMGPEGKMIKPRIVSLMNGTAESFDAPPPRDDSTPLLDKVIDTESDPAQEVIGQFEAQSEINDLLDALTMLSDNEFDILARWLNGDRMNTIAATEGVTDSRISQKIKTMVVMLRQYCGLSEEVTEPSDALRIGIHKQPNHEIREGVDTQRILQERLSMTRRTLSSSLATLERKGLVECDAVPTGRGNSSCKRSLRSVHFTPTNNVDDIRKRLDIDEPAVDITPFVAPRKSQPVGLERLAPAQGRAERASSQAESNERTMRGIAYIAVKHRH